MTRAEVWRVGTVDPRQVVDERGCVVATAANADDAEAIVGMRAEIVRLTGELAKRNEPRPPECNSCWSTLINGKCVGCAVACYVRSEGPDPFVIFPPSAHDQVRAALAEHGREVKP
ncbi:MAG: hypothetical protein MUF34_30760 [Polyangiaceae bacterium]|nr:hypothetical protein [Polyangiaceae bacterium]